MSRISVKNLRVGIIGGGFMARTHAAAARAAGAHVVAVSSSSPERTRQAAAAFGVAPAESVRQLIEEVDVVHVTSPNALHAEHALAALEAGKHVVCEKPLATDAATAAELAAAAAEAGVVATVPFVYRFHPMARQARAHAAAGGLGRLLTVRGAYLQDWMLDPQERNWRVDTAEGGPSRAFGDIGSHLVDLTEFLAGERIVRLNAATSRAFAERGGKAVETEDAAVLTVETASGAVGSLMVSQVDAGRKNALTLELAGTDSSVEFVQERPDELWIGGAESSRIVSRDASVLAADAARLCTVPAGHPMGYVDAFAAFARDTYAAIAGDAPDGLPTFEDGARANQLTAAVLDSAASGSWVDTGA